MVKKANFMIEVIRKAIRVKANITPLSNIKATSGVLLPSSGLHMAKKGNMEMEKLQRRVTKITMLGTPLLKNGYSS